MFERILVAVDGSEHAGRAVDLAAELARRHDAELVVLHVVAREGSSRIPPELQEFARLEHVYLTEQDLLRSAGEQLAERAAERARREGVEKVEVRVDMGRPGALIVSHAEGIGADLIVMGRRGLGDLKGLVLGSVSHKVSQLAPCAVLTVP